MRLKLYINDGSERIVEWGNAPSSFYVFENTPISHQVSAPIEAEFPIKREYVRDPEWNGREDPVPYYPVGPAYTGKPRIREKPPKEPGFLECEEFYKFLDELHERLREYDE